MLYVFYYKTVFSTFTISIKGSDDEHFVFQLYEMRNVLAFVVLAAHVYQSSARIDIASPIEKSLLDILVPESKCDLIRTERHHKNVDPKNLNFFWYNTRSHKESTLNLDQAAKVFHKEYDFENNDPILINIPGFYADNRSANVNFLRDGLTKLENVNYVLLDCSFYLKPEDVYLPEAYIKAVSNVYGIGHVLGNALAKFIKDGLRQEQLHVTGFSLGAHIAGYAAQRVYDIRRKKLTRISGVDPAAPCFDEMEVVDQISSDDAEYVDIYHSSKGLAGTLRTLGTANFFINSGGPQQPHCIGLPFLSVFCSHIHNSLNFWVDSALHPEKFMAQKCNSYERWKRGKCKDMLKVKAGLFSEPCKGNYYIDYEFDNLGSVINKISTTILWPWRKVTSVF